MEDVKRERHTKFQPSRITMGINTIERAVGQRIRKALGVGPGSSAERIQIAVHSDQVTLRGVVRTPDEVRAAERAAWATSGVDAVRNDLRAQEESAAEGESLGGLRSPHPEDPRSSYVRPI